MPASSATGAGRWHRHVDRRGHGSLWRVLPDVGQGSVLVDGAVLIERRIDRRDGFRGFDDRHGRWHGGDPAPASGGDRRDRRRDGRCGHGRGRWLGWTRAAAATGRAGRADAGQDEAVGPALVTTRATEQEQQQQAATDAADQPGERAGQAASGTAERRRAVRTSRRPRRAGSGHRWRRPRPGPATSSRRRWPASPRGRPVRRTARPARGVFATIGAAVGLTGFLVGLAVGRAVGRGVGLATVFAVGLAVGLGVARGVGRGVGFGVGLGVGFGCRLGRRRRGRLGRRDGRRRRGRPDRERPAGDLARRRRGRGLGAGRDAEDHAAGPVGEAGQDPGVDRAAREGAGGEVQPAARAVAEVDADRVRRLTGGVLVGDGEREVRRGRARRGRDRARREVAVVRTGDRQDRRHEGAEGHRQRDRQRHGAEEARAGPGSSCE